MVRGYHDLESRVVSLLELVPGAANLAAYLAITGEDEVLVLTEYSVPAHVVDAIGVAARLRGARVSVLTVEPFSPGGSVRTVPGPIVEGAWRNASVVISCAWWAELHSAPLFFTELTNLGARLAALHQTATAGALSTGARLPPEIFYEIKSRVLEYMVGAEEIRVTTRRGTDLTMRNIRIDTDNGPLIKPGAWSPFPYGGANWYPGYSVGTLAIEESTVTGVPEEPLYIELVGNTVAEIRGSHERRDLEMFGPDGYYLRHAFIGLNPKVRVKNAPQFEREKHAGAFYLGLDSIEARDGGKPGFAHCDCQFDYPTVTVNGSVLVDDGYLTVLDHPAVRETAARHGNPDRLLLPNPYVW